MHSLKINANMSIVVKGLLIFGLSLVNTRFDNAYASSANSTLSVNATLNNICILSGGSINFGTYSGSQLDGTVSLSITCTLDAPYTISLDAGTNPSTAGDVNTRRLKSGTNDFLSYQLYSDAARLLVWGYTIGTNTISASGTGSSQTRTVYGRIPAAQAVPAGSYTDAVVITLTF